MCSAFVVRAAVPMQVRVKVARRTSGIPGVAGRPEPRMEEGRLPYMEADSTTIKEVRTHRLEGTNSLRCMVWRC